MERQNFNYQSCLACYTREIKKLISNHYILLYVGITLTNEKFFVPAKERLRRLKICFHIMAILTIVFSAGEKILTYFCITQLGETESNLIPRFLIQHLGIIPAIIIGFLASIFPIITINYGIKRFKWNTELHYWILTVFMVVYFVLFFKVFEHNLSLFW